MTQEERKRYKQGLISAVLCGVWWGICPIYWAWLKPIESSTIIFYRIVLVAVVSAVGALIFYGKETLLAPLKDRKLVLRMLIAGIIITCNWSIYIWAINSGHIIQTSIGYYIEPLMVCLFGMIFFGEKLNRHKVVALLFGLAGVVAVIVYFREFPGIALSIAISFSIYAAIKKGINMPPLLSLTYETIFIAPFALVVAIYLEATGQGALGFGTGRYLLLLCCGFVTALPLSLFADAANKISMFLLGITEYISPTIALFIGIFYFREEFYPIQIIAFVIIWIGLIFFSIGEMKSLKGAENDG
ncbi:MAG: EamA family transporter RarD [Firmicutes bacterium]|nr:EamA family transporter RarD [Bacillota bacterium]